MRDCVLQLAPSAQWRQKILLGLNLYGLDFASQGTEPILGGRWDTTAAARTAQYKISISKSSLKGKPWSSLHHRICRQLENINIYQWFQRSTQCTQALVSLCQVTSSTEWVASWVSTLEISLSVNILCQTFSGFQFLYMYPFGTLLLCLVPHPKGAK